MVDFSSLFIVYEFLFQYFPGLEDAFSGSNSLFIWLGVAVGMGILIFVLHFFNNRVIKVIRVFAWIFLVLSALFTLVVAVNQFHRPLEDWAKEVFGLDPAPFYVYSLLVISGVVAIASLITSHFCPTRPNNDSTLNRRQKFQTLGVICILFISGLAMWYWAQEAFDGIALTLVFTAEFLSMLFWFYDPIIFILSRLLPIRTRPPLAPSPEKVNRFAILACAHNEEKVIGHLIDSLYAMNYPRSKYDVFVICDNCDDGTADVARERNAIAMERHDTENKGKGHALEWMFGILEAKDKEGDVYDAYIVLDADNLVNARYLNEVNAHLNQGHEIMQTYLGCKNPSDTWISKCYSMAYWISNSNYQDAHSRMGLSAQMGGTGMVFRPAMIRELKWEANSLTEDLVLTSKYVLKSNKACHWVHNARLYDEKPLSYKASVKQRTRWMQGHMDTMIQYAPKLLISGLRNMSFKQIDMSFYLMRPFLNLLMFFFYVVRWVSLLFFPDNITAVGMIMNFETATILVLAFILMQVYILNDEFYLRYAIWIPLQYVFTYTWYLPIFRGLVKYRERFWVSTIHGRDLSIKDIREDVMITEARRRLAGLDNLHRLPLGQLLLKAAVITGSQLQMALEIQRQQGGFLGNILVEMNALSEETLKAYVDVQATMKQTVQEDPSQLEKLRLGQILIDANVITEKQLARALEYQQEYGGMLGEALIQTNVVSQDLLSIFLEVQNLIGVNYINNAKAHQLIKGMVSTDSPDQHLEDLMVSSDLISNQQLEAAKEKAAIDGTDVRTALLDLGYVTIADLELIENVSNIAAAEQTPGGDA